MEKHKILMLMIMIILSISIIGCKNTTEVGGLSNTKTAKKVEEGELPITVEGDGYPLKVNDYLKKTVTLENKAQKAAVLSGTPLNIWYSLGGKSICTSDISENLKLIPEYREEILKLPTIGPVYSINMESVIAEKPDLIIAQVGTQGTQAKKLNDMGFDVINTHIRGYEDVISTYKAFGKILEEEEKAEDIIKGLKEKKNDIQSKLPEEGKSVVILYITSNALSVKLDNSIAGDVAKLLEIKNIASDLPPDNIGSENTPLDIEYIVGKNPDYVLVTSMISDNELAKESMEKEFRDNPVWKGVNAISEGNVIYLPQEYFLYNAGPYYGEAIEFMARSIYPEIYGEVDSWYGK